MLLLMATVSDSCHSTVMKCQGITHDTKHSDSNNVLELDNDVGHL